MRNDNLPNKNKGKTKKRKIKAGIQDGDQMVKK